MFTLEILPTLVGAQQHFCGESWVEVSMRSTRGPPICFRQDVGLTLLMPKESENVLGMMCITVTASGAGRKVSAEFRGEYSKRVRG